MSACNHILLSTSYLPNIQYFSKIISCNNVTIEVYENYQKQTYRNRATILGANGPLDIIIPVIRPNGNHTRTLDILIDYTLPWLQAHWRTIVSAYKNSPFFDFFEQEFQNIFTRKEKFLLDWNLLLLDNLHTMVGVQKQYLLTETYNLHPDDNDCDYRDAIHPKKRLQRPDVYFEPVPYSQVFSEKYNFTANLSIIDLLFNEGPQTASICRQCYKK
jgi:hypothetical protein